MKPADTSGNDLNPSANSEVIYQERQWVPWYFWVLAAIVIAVTTATVGLNRSGIWPLTAAIVLIAVAVWVLVSWSSTVVTVEKDPDGTRWLSVKDAQLPSDVVARSLAVPKSARRNALGPQLDPAAFLSTHEWVDELAMFVLDDPDDPTPYWLIASKDPAALIEAFVPEQAEQAVRSFRSA